MKEVDITKHELVPKHVLLNEQEKESLLKKYGIVLRQLPRISSNDPVIKILNGKNASMREFNPKDPIMLPCIGEGKQLALASKIFRSMGSGYWLITLPKRD